MSVMIRIPKGRLKDAHICFRPGIMIRLNFREAAALACMNQGAWNPSSVPSFGLKFIKMGR